MIVLEVVSEGALWVLGGVIREDFDVDFIDSGVKVRTLPASEL